jgi:hypothetical protein
MEITRNGLNFKQNFRKLQQGTQVYSEHLNSGNATSEKVTFDV